MKRNKALMFLLSPTIIANFGVVAYATGEVSEENKDIEIKELEKTDDYTLININGENLKKVRLPNGNWVNEKSFNYIVNKNGSYDFVYETNNETDGQNVATYAVTGIRASYLITGKEDVSLKLSAQDLLSGMGTMKVKNEATGTWTAYENYATSKDWKLDSTEGLKTVYVTYKDIAGNETSEIFDKIILDKTGPQVSTFVINNNDAYTKDRNVTLTVSATDNYAEVSKLLISNDNKVWTEVPYSPTVKWVLPTGSGSKTVYLKAVDSIGNIGAVATDSIYLDYDMPTGSIKINNGATITNSRNVKLQLSFADAHSGIKRVTIIEKDKIYNFPTVPTSPAEIDWTLSHGATGKVTLEVEDKAGNVYRVDSNTIVIATLEVTQFRLTDVVNPSVSTPTNPFKPIVWTFPAQEMKSGANIAFDINYKLDLDDKTKSVINGTYYIEVIGDNGYHKVIQAKYDSAIANGFIAKVKLPDDAPKEAKVYLSSTIVATLSNDVETFTNEAFFPGKGEKALIGVIKGNIKEDIIFHEVS